MDFFQQEDSQCSGTFEKERLDVGTEFVLDASWRLWGAILDYSASFEREMLVSKLRPTVIWYEMGSVSFGGS